MIGGGTGPATGTNATTCTPGHFNLEMMMRAIEDQPMNFGFLGKGTQVGAIRWSSKFARELAASNFMKTGVPRPKP
ncbi:MAG: hypothetical protein CM15mP125_3190 [Gammaproteobacteria bacterium]|nr:MAG: hypothetical protein CM15mP125_3190 [Gammaproteobacteria bacterium]